MSGMCTCGGMVGWKGALLKSSHHRGCARCQEKGKKEWSDDEPVAQAFPPRQELRVGLRRSM